MKKKIKTIALGKGFEVAIHTDGSRLEKRVFSIEVRTHYTANGIKTSEYTTRVDDGVAEGVEAEWHPDGQPIFERIQKDGETISYREWNTKGELVT